jgi:hypothetical protein
LKTRIIYKSWSDKVPKWEEKNKAEADAAAKEEEFGL